MKKFFPLVLILMLFAVEARSQLFVADQPEGKTLESRQPVARIELSDIIAPALQRSGEKLPLYAGYTLPFEDKYLKRGNWEQTPTGWWVWKLEIHKPLAKGLNVYLKDLNLQSGDKLFIYSPDQNVLLGAFTSLNNSVLMGTEFIPGSSLVIEFNTLSSRRDLPFQIEEIGVSVLDLGTASRDFGDSGPCEVLVNCPEGADWKSQRDGVARVLVNGGGTLFWCSGSLMNNTSLDGSPYFLTANHCGETSTEEDYAKWVFYFNFESVDCVMPDEEPPHQSLSGATLIANSAGSTNAGSDFKLLFLNDEVPKSYGVFYNGWDWSGDGASSGVGIHHPEGDLKMISTFTDDLISTNYNNPTPVPDGKYWMVTWVETESGHGVTEGGSSGSPIFSEEGYVVGALSGGRASCTFPDRPDYYGKMSYSWNSNGPTPSRQLQPWLDPMNTGQEKLRGFYLDSTSVLADFEASTTNVRVGGRVSFTNLSEGEIQSYEWHFEGGTPDESELINPSLIQYNSAGDFDVMLIAKSLKDADTLVKKDYIHVTPTITPNPSRGYFKITFGGSLPDELDLLVSDLQGRRVNYFTEILPSENAIVLDLSRQASGVYIITILADGVKETLKAVVIRHTTE